MSSKKYLVPFFTAGYPELHSTSTIIQSLDNVGSDYIEIGLAHSDALADGPVIQESSHRALSNGMNIEVLFQQVKACPPTKAKLILFSYFNPIVVYGIEKVVKAWSDAGGSCLLVPDLPIEESETLSELCNLNGLSLIHLVAPTSTPERIKNIVQHSTEFIYLVSVTGVTGGKSAINLEEIQQTILTIKKINPNIPVLIGFGIASPEHAKNALSIGADGVIIGSALIRKMKDENLLVVESLLKEIRQTLNVS
jgi:tryptophan synthase alpha chain